MTNPSPAISFEVDLTLLRNEKVGPLTTEGQVNMEVSDLAANRTTRRDQLSTYLPTLNVGGNRILKHGDTFTEYGMKAVYLRDMYGVGYAPTERAYLKIVSVD